MQINDKKFYFKEYEDGKKSYENKNNKKDLNITDPTVISFLNFEARFFKKK